MSTPLILAVTASFFWGIGTAMQKHGVETSFPKITLKQLLTSVFSVLKTLILNPSWAVGLGSMIGGMLCFSYALAHGDISLVQPLINLTMVIAALIGVFFLGEKVTGIEWGGISVMLIGVVFVSIEGGEPTSVQPETGKLVLIGIIFTTLMFGSLFLGKIVKRLGSEFTLALAAGFGFGLANTMGKVLTQRVIEEVGEFSLTNLECLISIATDFPLWFVILANVVAFFFSQTAFANGRVSLISPIMTILANTTPVVAAIMAFNENVGWARGTGIGLAVIGTFMLAMKKEEVSDED